MKFPFYIAVKYEPDAEVICYNDNFGELMSEFNEYTEKEDGEKVQTYPWNHPKVKSSVSSREIEYLLNGKNLERTIYLSTSAFGNIKYKMYTISDYYTFNWVVNYISNYNNHA